MESTNDQIKHLTATDGKPPVGSSALSDDEMDGTTEICEPERCLYCDMDGSWRNGFHVIGCPNGMLS